MAKNMSNEVKDNLPASVGFMEQLEQDSNTGFENVGIDDVSIPYLTILQSMSPQVRKGESKVEGAEEGLIYNTVTQELFEKIRVIPVAYIKSYVEWVPRDQGGGFVKAHKNESIKKECSVDDKGNHKLPSGNIIRDTAYHYVIRLSDDGTFERAVIAMTSTALKKSRQWNAMMMNLQVVFNGKRFNPPPYSHVYNLSTTLESNQHGEWYTFRIGKAEILKDAELYEIAKEFHKDVLKGEVEVAEPPSDSSKDNENTPF